ncbi:MAG: AIDA repeat-containing protein, partial [Lentisphaeria bacterium]|nr:AIDA repeat-containing protein [Lentisphaeria bacterium]
MSQSEIGTVVGDATIVNYFEQNSSYLLNFSVGDTQKAYLASRNILDYSAFGIDGTYSGPGVIDAEKRTSTYFPKDADLCWAGAAANILEFSGWGDVAGLSNEDDIYDFLKNAFAANNNETVGGSTMGAVDWFVNGTKYSALGTSPKFYTSGAEVKNYACDINLAAQLQAAMEGGNAIGLSVSFLYHDGSPTPAGHALTIFGFTYDERYDITDPRYLTGVFIADSDDSKDQLDSRASQNTLTLVTVEWNEELGAYCMPYYGGGATMTVLNYIHTIEFRPLEYAEDPDKAQGNFVSIKEGEISYNAQLGGKNETRLQIVGSGAIAVSANVGYNGIQRVLGMASDTVVSGSGAVTALQDVRSGGVAYGGKILAGGEQYVSGGGVASGTLVGKDGTQVIYSGASALDVTVASGGVQKVGDSGSVVRDTVVESGGAQLLTGGASAIGTVVETSGIQTIEDGAIGVFDRIHGIQFVDGGSAVDTVIESTGLQTISGGEVLRAQVHGEQYLTNGAAVSATVHAGGEVLQTGGVFEDGYVSSGGVVMGVGGQVTGLTILSYGVQLVASDAVASNTVIRNRGFQYVQNGGSAVGGKVAGYGYVYAGEGAQVKNYQFAAYGSAVIDSGAVVSDFTMGSGAMISVLDGGTATNVALAEGARLNTIFGTGITAAVNGTNANGSFSVENGTAVNLLIARDALAVAADGAMAQNITIENGGLLAVTGYAVLAGTTVIAGQLQVTGYAEAQDVVIDLAGQAPSGSAFISDSALLSFESLTVDVSAVGSNGRYKLAGNAREFVCAVTVQDSAGYQLMEVGDSWIGSDGYYELLISGGGELMLSVSVFNSGMADPVVSVNTAETTSSEVVLTVVYDENAVSKLYSFNGSDWFDYTGDITVTENGTYYFRGVAADGSSAITRYEVSNFDPEALSLPVITASSTGPTVGYITLSAVFDEDATANYYSFDGSIWYEYDGDVKVTGNGDVYFRSMNGNYTVTQTYTVDNIVSFIKEEGTSATPRPGNFTTGIPARDELAYAYVLTTTPAQIVANRDVYIFTNTDHEEDGGRFVNADNGNYALAILTNGAMLTIGGNPTSQMPNIYCRRPELTNNTSSEGAGGTTPVKSYGVIFEGDTNYLAFSEATGGVTSQNYSDRAIWILCEGSDATALSGDTVYVLGNLAGTLQGMGETTFNFTEDMVPYGTWEEDPESGELVFKLGNFRLPANMSSISNSAYATGAAMTGDLVIGNDFSGIIEAQSTVDKTVDLALSAKWATESQQSHVTLGDTNGTVSASALTVGGELQLSAGDFAGKVIATASNSRYLFSTIEWEDEPAEDEGGEEGEEGGDSSGESKDDNVARSGVVTGQKFLASGIQAGSVDTAWFSGDVTAEVQNNVFSLDMTYNTSVASSIRMGGMTFSAVAVSVGSLTIGNSFTGSLTATVRDITMDMIWDDSRTKGDGDPISLTLTYDANTIKGVGLEVTDTLTVGGNFGGSIKINGGEFSYHATRFGIGPDEKALDFNPSSYLYAGLLADNINIKGSLSSDISFTCYDTSFGQAPAAFYGVIAGVADSVSHATLKVLTAADFSGSITVDAESGNSGLWVTGMGATVYYNGNDNIFDIAGTIDTGSALEAYALVSSAMSFRISGKVVSKDYAVYHNPGDTGYDLQTEADYLEVAAGGEVYGNIGFGDTTNTMVIDSNATVIGSLLTTMGAIDLVFNLNDQAMSGTAKSSGVALTVGNSLVLTTTSITVNLNDATAGESYALIQDENMERWLGQVITVNYQGSEADLVIGGSTAGFGFSVSADVIDNQLVISVDELAEGLAGDAPTALKVTSINSEVSARLAWTSATRGAVSVLEYRINGKGSVVVETTASDFRLYGLEEGDLVEWRVREESDKGAVTGAWSETEAFTVGGGSAIVGTVRSLSCKKISGAVAKLDWGDVYCSEGLAYYEVRYCQTAGTPTWADGTYVSKTVTASELLISNLGSSETVYCQVRTVDKDGNAGEWASVGTGGNLKVDNTPMVFTYGTNLEVESVSCGDDSCDVNFSWGIAQEVGSVQSGFDSYVLCFQKGTYSVTSDNTPVFTLDASASLYSITINDQYTTDVFYNTATDGLAEGTYLWWVDAYDQAGNVTGTGQSRFLVDFTAPQGSFSSLDQPVVTVLRGGTDDDSGNNNYESDEEGDGEETTPVVGEVSSARVSFSWDANFTDNLSAVSYRVDISSDKYFSVNKSFSFYTDSMSLTLDSSNENSVGALLGKDTVYWRVVAVDECGNESLASAVQSFQFIDEATQSAIVETTAPSEILLFEAEQRGNRMHFDWSAAYDAFGVKNYRLSLKKKNGATEIITVDGGETSFEYKNLADGIYSVSITAVNYAGLSSGAAVISNLVMDTVAPVMPDKVEGRVLGSDICISWDAAEDNIKVAGYELTFSKVKTVTSQGVTSWSVLTTQTVRVDAKELDYWMYSVSDGNYVYSVRAFDGSGNYSVASTETLLTVNAAGSPGSSFNTAMLVTSGET